MVQKKDLCYVMYNVTCVCYVKYVMNDECLYDENLKGYDIIFYNNDL